MDENDLLKYVTERKAGFGPKCSKYAGSVTVELLRQALSDVGFPMSERDVFVRGVPYEIDLLVPEAGVIAEDRIVFEPAQVQAVLEIKNAGSFGADTSTRIRRVFDAVVECNKSVKCAYITLAERKNFRQAVVEEVLGYPAFTLFEYTGGDRSRQYVSTGQWSRFLEFLRRATAANAQPFE